MTKALITGGSGFIGSHLCEKLLDNGDHVTVLDNLATGRLENIATLRPHPNFRFVEGSVLDVPLVNKLVEQCDEIYHLASAVGVQLIIDQPVNTIQTIVDGTRIVLQAASQTNKPILLTSTSEVYGKGLKVPFSENDDVVLGPTSTRRWLYASAKMLDEFLALAHWYETKLPVIIVRLFNTVGPRQIGQYGMVVPRFVQKALAGEPLTVYGDGQQARCFCHVSDATNAIIRLMDQPQSYGKVINVGSEEEITILNLAKTIIDMTQSKSQITYLTYEQAYTQGFEDMLRRVPDLTRAKELIDHQPSYDLKGVIQSTIDYWSNQQHTS
ncbi:MAG: GDP-mannose 4,6-dehydratase, partial [Phycisphaeraceae bacterium]|nr:GDP-mannose 4,6-dehydratase [Phycisphaeraceae bacterium]